MRAIDLDGVPEAEPVAPVPNCWRCGNGPAMADLENLCIECVRERLFQPTPPSPYTPSPWLPTTYPTYPPVSVPFVQTPPTPFVQDNTYDDGHSVTVTTGGTTGDLTGVVFYNTGWSSSGANGQALTITNIGTGTLTFSDSTTEQPPQAPPQDVTISGVVKKGDFEVSLALYDEQWKKAIKSISDSMSATIGQHLFKGFVA